MVFNAAVISNPLTGVARYAFELADALSRLGAEPEYWTWTRLRSALRTRLGPEATIRTFPDLRGVGTAILPGLMAGLGGVDLFHFPNGDLFRCGVPRVAMIHDLAPFIFREMFPDDLGEHYRNRIENVVRNCDALVVNSRTTMNDLLERFPEAGERTFLTLLGSDHLFPCGARDTASMDHAGSRFLLTVGTIEPRKNYRSLIRAYHRVLSRQSVDTPDLVICGGMGYRSEEVTELVERLDLSKRVTFTGYVSDEKLSSLYRNAVAYVHPALYEGYGFPVVEALRSGLPVAAADNSAVKELFSGLYVPFDAESTESITDALRALLDGAEDDDAAVRSQLVSEALGELTWEECARETLKAFSKVVA